MLSAPGMDKITVTFININTGTTFIEILRRIKIRLENTKGNWNEDYEEMNLLIIYLLRGRI